ncbi:MAG TPA: MBOAT family O-acyltransferase [Steroidobacteraceae bacterium]
MLFNSGIFALFFAAFLPLYLLSRRHVTARNSLLIFASYVFYGWWDPRFLILVAVSTSVDYIAALGAAGKPVRPRDMLKSAAFLAAATIGSLAVAARRDWWLCAPVAAGMLVIGLMIAGIHAAPEHARRRGWLLLSLTTNLGILAFFKYFNFFVGSAVALLGSFGLHPHAVSFAIILPVGLSFYTFQAISRTIDSYRGVFDPQYSLINYAAFHAFFPQLVAGPIERAAHLMPQFETVRPLDHRLFTSGALLFAWGLYQKIVIADNVSPIADAVFTAPAHQTAGATLAAVLAFTVQIYCDFCGYSNMAQGLARCIGFDLMTNFNQPYFARTPSEFWQRWHISLSRWLRDYLYISLGGNRHGRIKMYRNLMITMLLGGLWHGASWTFVAWGAFHGAIQVVYRVLRIDAAVERARFGTVRGFAIQASSWLATLTLVCVGWILFRSRTFEDAVTVIANLFGTTGYTSAAFSTLAAYTAPLVLVEIYQRASGHLEVLTRGPFLVRYTAALTLMLTLAAFSAAGGREFIYFDF